MFSEFAFFLKFFIGYEIFKIFLGTFENVGPGTLSYNVQLYQAKLVYGAEDHHLLEVVQEVVDQGTLLVVAVPAILCLVVMSE